MPDQPKRKLRRRAPEAARSTHANQVRSLVTALAPLAERRRIPPGEPIVVFWLPMPVSQARGAIANHLLRRTALRNFCTQPPCQGRGGRTLFEAYCALRLWPPLTRDEFLSWVTTNH